jgi:hypothetical protein
MTHNFSVLYQFIDLLSGVLNSRFMDITSVVTFHRHYHHLRRHHHHRDSHYLLWMDV